MWLDRRAGLGTSGNVHENGLNVHSCCNDAERERGREGGREEGGREGGGREEGREGERGQGGRKRGREGERGQGGREEGRKGERERGGREEGRERLVADTQFTNSTYIVHINWVQRWLVLFQYLQSRYTGVATEPREPLVQHKAHWPPLISPSVLTPTLLLTYMYMYMKITYKDVHVFSLTRAS